MREVRCREVSHFRFLEQSRLGNRNILYICAMKDLRRLFLIINPISGTHSKIEVAKYLIDALEHNGFDVTAEFTLGQGDATRLARQAVDLGYDGVLAWGGDGTINETACAMVNTGVPMGIIPAGSGNGLARHLGIPIDALSSTQVIAQRFVRDCDYGTVNDRPFFCTFGIGFDAAVSSRFAASGTRGKMNYVKSALQEFINYEPKTYKIIADGEEIAEEAFLIAICNAAQYGNNAYIAPDASIADGLLDLVVVHKMSRLNLVMMSMELMAGTLNESRGVTRRKVKEVIIFPNEPGPAHLDGEPIEHIGEKICVKCRPGALRIFTNTHKTVFKPIITPVQAMFNDMELAIRKILYPNTLSQ